MFKYIKKLTYLVIISGVLFSCDSYLDINQSPNASEEIPDLDLVLADMTLTAAYNFAGGGNLSRNDSYWMQYISTAAEPPNIDTYQINTSTYNNDWAFNAYSGVLANGKYVIDQGTETEAWNHVAIAQILQAYVYGMLTDHWGDIPFSEALLRVDNLKPTYDTQEAVIEGIQTLLDNAIANIDKGAVITVGGGDFFASGDMDVWKKTAYTLKARYYLRLTNAPGKDATTQANLALTALQSGLTSNAENPTVTFLNETDSNAPWAQWIEEFVQGTETGEHFINLLNTRNDPRIVIVADTATGGTYVGYPNGSTDDFSDAEISDVGDAMLAYESMVPLITYTELKFMEAEAQLRLGNTADAYTAFETAIKAHMDYLSTLPGTAATQVIDATAQTTYLTGLGLDAASLTLDDIITEKYISGYIFAPTEAYNDYRRTGFPSTLAPVSNAVSQANGQIPTRLIYTDTEILNNKDNVPSDVTISSTVWWDGN